MLPLGNEKHLLFPPHRAGTADDTPLAVDESDAADLWTARAPAHADLVIGREALLAVDLDAAYLIDADSAAAIPAGQPVPAVVGAGVGRIC